MRSSFKTMLLLYHLLLIGNSLILTCTIFILATKHIAGTMECRAESSPDTTGYLVRQQEKGVVEMRERALLAGCGIHPYGRWSRLPGLRGKERPGRRKRSCIPLSGIGEAVGLGKKLAAPSGTGAARQPSGGLVDLRKRP